MSHLFESFKFMDRGRDVRELENQSLRSMFLWLLAALFVLGMLTSMMIDGLFRLHRFSWSIALAFPALIFLAFRLSRLIYRRLGR
jgi:bacteriorhodopsin